MEVIKCKFVLKYVKRTNQISSTKGISLNISRMGAFKQYMVSEDLEELKSTVQKSRDNCSKADSMHCNYVAYDLGQVLDSLSTRVSGLYSGKVPGITEKSYNRRSATPNQMTLGKLLKLNYLSLPSTK